MPTPYTEEEVLQPNISITAPKVVPLALALPIVSYWFSANDHLLIDCVYCKLPGAKDTYWSALTEKQPIGCETTAFLGVATAGLVVAAG